MQRRALERKPAGRRWIWTCASTATPSGSTSYESAQLTPGAVVELFRVIHEHRDRHTRPLGDAPCAARLPRRSSRSRTTCSAPTASPTTDAPSGHGRLTTFFQFLREKNFVRSLTRARGGAAQGDVKQVRCSRCGATVDPRTRPRVRLLPRADVHPRRRGGEAHARRARSAERGAAWCDPRRDGWHARRAARQAQARAHRIARRRTAASVGCRRKASTVARWTWSPMRLRFPDRANDEPDEAHDRSTAGRRAPRRLRR